MPNFAKIDKILDWIEAHPERHDQSYWCKDGDGPTKPRTWCDTTLCMAGTVVMRERAGWKPSFYTDDDGLWQADNVVNTKTGDVMPISIVAAAILDIDDREKENLFYISADLEDLRDTVARMKEEHGVTK